MPVSTPKSKKVLREARILTLHPEGKAGFSISRKKYDQIKSALIGVLRRKGELTFTALLWSLETALRKSFSGSISWYGTVVKLDLESRGAIVCKRGGGRQRIHLARRRARKARPAR